MSNHRRSHVHTAQDHLEAVAIYRARLVDLRREPISEQAHISELHNDIGHALKLADVQATLAVAEQLARVVELFTRPATIELVPADEAPMTESELLDLISVYRGRTAS